MKTIIKRTGKVEDFDENKVKTAIGKAFTSIDFIITQASQEIIDNITSQISAIDKQLSVEEVQDMVEDALMSTDRKDVARAYIRYRYKKEVLRKENSTDQSLLELIQGSNDYWNNENSNKNSKIVTTQRDYFAGITLTDITKRFLLPPEVVKAHEDGIIHFHDMDYFAQNVLHNCFARFTKFYTKDGLHSFLEYKDGDHVIVPTHTGNYKNATVKSYGQNILYQIVFESENDKNSIFATANHRWLLQDNTIKTTLELTPGDKLFKDPFNPDVEWTHAITIHAFESDTWCLNVEDDHSFILEGGIVTMNCELINLEDMLQNGTVINGVLIEKPHRLLTAATIATQIILAVSSSSYGGATISLTHLAPFVKDSRNYYLKKYQEKGLSEELVEKLAHEDTLKEIRDAVQTFNYQVNSMTSTNGQSPFLSVCMYTNENKEYKNEVALLIEEFLNQRILGFKNEKGVYVTPAFPKLLYVLDEDNMTPESEFYYLTKLAAKCTAKRMVPDYISAKVMRQLKINRFGIGDVYPCMGALTGDSTIIVRRVDCDVCTKPVLMTTFRNFWNNLSCMFEPCHQVDGIIDNLYFNTEMMKSFEVYDTKVGWTKIVCFMRNTMCGWVKVAVEKDNGTIEIIKCTVDHPWPVCGRGDVPAEELKAGDVISYNKSKTIDAPHKGVVGKCKVVDVTRYNNREFAYDFETCSHHFEVDGYYTHNCRSFLTPWRASGNISNAQNYEEGKGKYYGRFNQGVVTINLPDVALSSNGDESKFWSILNERLELCHKALKCRYERLSKGTSNVAPILWQHGALARLGKGKSFEHLLREGYSTISLGYAGLYECVKYMLGVSHTTEKGKEFGMEVMKFLNKKCREWKATEDIDYSVYGTPIESVTYKFAKALKHRFGKDVFAKMDGKDRNYITNSYHVPVFEKIDPFEKLSIESHFQELSPGGAISYIECSSLIKNPEAVMEVIKFIYDNIMYAELNIKSDFCQKCNYQGEIKIIDVDGKLDWECPNCGNRDHDTMNVSRRTCGYIGTNFFNQGRTNEIRDRYVHLDDHEDDN